jgi:hypothetical protein
MPITAPAPDEPVPPPRAIRASPVVALGFLIYSLAHVGLEACFRSTGFLESHSLVWLYWLHVGMGSLLGAVLVTAFLATLIGGLSMSWRRTRMRTHYPKLFQELLRYEAEHGLNRREYLAIGIGVIGALILLLPAVRVLAGFGNLGP